MPNTLLYLLPAPSEVPIDARVLVPRTHETVSKTRSTLPTACGSCRLKKLKCDGQRPICRRCLTQRTRCVYRAAEGETSSAALKRKYHDLEEENVQYQELYNFIRQRPQQEAQDIFHRIRTSQDPLHVLQSIKDADILLSYSTSIIPGEVDPRLKKLDREALDLVPIKVHARPWTVVADDGIVSELISGFFEVDHLYYIPAIDRDTFLDDMKKTNIVEAKLCSPLLVNAICAYRCFWSLRTRTLGLISGQDIADRFLQESKRLLDSAIGRPSILTLIALYFMFLTVTFQGKDRAALMYRYMAVTLFQQLQMSRRFLQLKDEIEIDRREKRLISTAAWGIYHLECRICSFYRQPSLIPRPSVPKLFDQSGCDDPTIQQNVDIFGKPFTDSSTHLPRTPGILHAATELTVIAGEVFAYNALGPDQRHKDTETTTRLGLYERLKKFSERLPERFQHAHNFTPQACLLSSHVADVATSILNPLDSGIIIPLEQMTVKALIIQYCRQEVQLGERFLKHWPHAAHGVIGRGQFLALASSVSFLEDEDIQLLFASGCSSLHFCTRVVPALRTLLGSIEALAWSMNKKIPASALPYFQNLERVADISDLPTSFVLPPLKALPVFREEGKEDDNSGNPGNEISRLVARWAALTVDVR